MRTPRKKSNKKKLIAWLVIIVIILLVAAGFLYLKYGLNHATTQQSPSTNKQSSLKSAESTTPNQTNTKPSDSQSNGGSGTTSPTNNKVTVDVTIVDAAQYQSNIEVRAYSSDVSTTGVCTFTFTKNGYSDIVRQTNGNVNSSTTACSELTIPASSFPTTGTWSLVVTYSSDSAQGSSNPQSVEIN